MFVHYTQLELFMPREGFASITIREETHHRLKQEYEKNKDKLALQGIYGFGAYCTKVLEDMLDKENQRID